MASGVAVSLAPFSPQAQEALACLSALLGPGRPAWVVGGALRDSLLGHPVGDLDVALPSGALTVGRVLADRLGSAFVALDERRGAGRVVGTVQVDLTDFRGPVLADDLRARDFTVNALAAPLHLLVSQGQAVVEDPTGGLRDLADRLVRLCAPAALRDDPVRALRGVRLALLPAWRLHPEVETAAREVAPAILTVAAERLRDELAALLGEPRAGWGLRTLDRLDVLAVLLPESRAMRETSQPEPHRFDVWEHSLRAVEAADVLAGHPESLGPWGERVADHLAEGLGDGLTRRETLKLAALLHDVAKPETRSEADGRVRFLGHDVKGAERAGEVAGRLRLSRHAGEVIQRLVRHHLRPMHLAQAGAITRRSRYRFSRDLGDEALDLVLLAVADAAAVRGDSPADIWNGPAGGVVRELLAAVGEDDAAASAPPLLRGEDVMEAFRLDPGPEVGRLLALAREAQALGLVSSREDALTYLRGSAGSSGSAGSAGAALDTPPEGP
jgi:putative nucleotidyltransferase with HDIG domain